MQNTYLCHTFRGSLRNEFSRKTKIDFSTPCTYVGPFFISAEENSKAKHKEPIELHLHAPSKLGDNLKNPFNKPDTSCLFDRDLTPY